MIEAEAYEFARFVAWNEWEDVIADPRADGIVHTVLRAHWQNTHQKKHIEKLK